MRCWRSVATRIGSSGQRARHASPRRRAPTGRPGTCPRAASKQPRCSPPYAANSAEPTLRRGRRFGGEPCALHIDRAPPGLRPASAPSRIRRPPRGAARRRSRRRRCRRNQSAGTRRAFGAAASEPRRRTSPPPASVPEAPHISSRRRTRCAAPAPRATRCRSRAVPPPRSGTTACTIRTWCSPPRRRAWSCLPQRGRSRAASRRASPSARRRRAARRVALPRASLGREADEAAWCALELTRAANLLATCGRHPRAERVRWRPGCRAPPQ